ncbi:MAG: hypothetical protein E7635_02330 [Ruminococcaceae bacterium]|nr:hypothetical protein [Oscillospiraceae bacterium]
MKKLLAFILALVTVFSPLTILAADTSDSANEFFYEKASDAIIQKYMDECEALINEIENSPTEVTVTGTKYYVSSSNGNDKNDGLSPEKAWKTIEKVNSMTLKPGDGVFFKRGDTWRYFGSLNAKSGITYSAYGEGAKPYFICSLDAAGAEKWTLTDAPNVYRYNGIVGGQDTDIGCIVFDGGRAWGIMVVKESNGLRKDNGPVFNGIDYYDNEALPFNGYADLIGNLEFWHDVNEEILYIRCNEGNPGEVFKSIELVDDDPAINLVSEKFDTPDEVMGVKEYAHDILVDNINIFGASFGVGAQNVKNVTVQNCIFKWIGGNIQGAKGFETARYGNAVESFGYSDNFVIQHNYASQVYDCCWTAQHTGAVVFNGLIIRENVAEYANTGPEVWLNQNGKPGAVVTNMKIYNNYNRYIGHGWSHQRPGEGPEGGIFYGARVTHETSGSTFSNNDVYNNVNIFAGGGTGNYKFIHKDAYNFHDNTYILEYGKRYATFEPWANAKSYRYYKADLQAIYNMGYDPGSKFYYIDEKDLLEMYKTAIPNNGVGVFEDIADNFWGRESVDYVALKGLFNGVTPTTFSPDGKMTRAMLVTVLARLAGNTDKGTSTYTDVNQNAWYAPGVAWAEANNIVNKGGKFRPDENATREEMADMLYRYAKMYFKEGNLDGAQAFSDSSNITAAYADGVKFCTKNGIIGGYPDGTVGPKKNATRTEVATMIMRFVSYLAKAESDSSKVLAKETDAIVLKGEALKSVLDNSLVKPALETDGSVKFVPFAEKGAPTISLMHAYNPSIDMFKNPYVVVKYKCDIDSASITAMLVANGSNIKARSFADENALLIDMSSYTSTVDRSTYKNSMIIRLTPWGSTSRELDLTDYFTVEEIVFFDNLPAAQAYAG